MFEYEKLRYKKPKQNQSALVTFDVNIFLSEAFLYSVWSDLPRNTKDSNRENYTTNQRSPVPIFQTTKQFNYKLACRTGGILYVF